MAITAPPRSHKLLGVASGVSSPETFPAFPPGLSCFSEERQFHGGSLYKPPGRDPLPTAAQIGSWLNNVGQCALSVPATKGRLNTSKGEIPCTANGSSIASW